jgi:hypothetical protein
MELTGIARFSGSVASTGMISGGALRFFYFVKQR